MAKFASVNTGDYFTNEIKQRKLKRLKEKIVMRRKNRIPHNHIKLKVESSTKAVSEGYTVLVRDSVGK